MFVEWRMLTCVMVIRRWKWKVKINFAFATFAALDGVVEVLIGYRSNVCWLVFVKVNVCHCSLELAVMDVSLWFIIVYNMCKCGLCFYLK
jgi:predicted membrane chloride channel (bestrophin family)